MMVGFVVISHFLRQLLLTDPSTDWGMFTPERMPSTLVTHVQDIVNGAPRVPCPFFHLLPPPFHNNYNLLYTAFLGAVYPNFVGSSSTPSLPNPSAQTR